MFCGLALARRTSEARKAPYQIKLAAPGLLVQDQAKAYRHEEKEATSEAGSL